MTDETVLQNPGQANGGEHHHDKRHDAAAERARFGRKRRNPARPDDRDEEDITGIEGRQHDAGDEGAFVHVAHRLAELVSHDNQDKRGRDDLCQRARGRNDTRGDAAVIAVAQHDRQRDQAHRDDRGRDHARRCREQRTDENHGIGKATTDRPEELADGVEKVFRHARALEDQTHEREERDGEQHVVVHDAVDTFRQGLQEVRHEEAELDADDGEEQAAGGKREGHRIAHQQKGHQRGEHHRRHVVREPAGEAGLDLGGKGGLGAEKREQDKGEGSTQERAAQQFRETRRHRTNLEKRGTDQFLVGSRSLAASSRRCASASAAP